MKSTGIVRKVDDLGRIVIPKEIRNVLMIGEKDPLEIFMDGDSVVLKAYKPLCYLCGGSKDLKQYMNRNICADCREKAKELMRLL